MLFNRPLARTVSFTYLLVCGIKDTTKTIIKTIIKYLKVFTIAPPNLFGKPKIIVALINLFNIPVNLRRILKINVKTKIHIRKAIPSYKTIFNVVMSLKIPPNEKNGKLSIRMRLIGVFKIIASANIKIEETSLTTLVKRPYFQPSRAPKISNIIRIMSINII